MNKRLRGPDWPLVILLLALFALGLVALYSAGGEARFWIQFQRGMAGLALMMLLAFVPLPILRTASPIFFIGVLVALLAVLLFGVRINNARRWLNVGFLLQPSELMKVALPLFIAYLYSHLQETRWWHHLFMLALVSMPVLLVAKQPDLGTAVMVGAAGIIAIFFGGIGWRWIAGFSGLALAMLPILWSFMLKPYQKKRVLTLFDPQADPLGAGYHTIQSEIAIGSGGVWGKGFLSGTQAQFGFLPERHTDFIFAVFAEEFGLAGSCALLALVALIVWRCLLIAGRAVDFFSYIIAAGMGGIFFVTFTVNLSMVSGLLPVVGMPLPLVSYGGTALLASFIGFGLVLAVARQRQARL